MFRCSNRAIHKMILVTLMAFLCTAGTNSALAAPPKAKAKAKAKTIKSKSSKAKAIKSSVKAHPKAHLAAKAALNKRFRYSRYNYRHLPVIAPRVARVVAVPVVKRVATVNVSSGPVVVVDQPEQAVDNNNQPILGRVVRVVDGQTLLVSSGGNRRKVRLLGIDLVRSEESEINFEQESKRHLKKLVLGKQVSLAHDESVAKEDEEGVEVAYVYRNGDNTFLNLKMIRDGYSLAATTYEYQLSDIFAGQQEQAQEQGVGVWAHVEEPSES